MSQSQGSGPRGAGPATSLLCGRLDEEEMCPSIPCHLPPVAVKTSWPSGHGSRRAGLVPYRLQHWGEWALHLCLGNTAELALMVWVG